MAFFVATSSTSSCSPSTPELLLLPRDCLMRIMSLLRASDFCRMARVCRRFRNLADSDEVWATLVPSDPAPFLSRKDLFFRELAGMTRKDPSQPYWLDPETGEGFFVKSARQLHIVWGDDMRYWHWASQPDSWFPESAVLDRVCWFEVAGEFESMFLPGTYTVSFRVKLRVDPGRSWSRAPVKFYLSANNGQNVEVQRFFDDRKNGEITNLARLRRLPSYPWMELDIGEFVVDKEMHVALKYQMMEIEGGQWKSGIIVDCLKIQPSSAIRGVAEGAT